MTDFNKQDIKKVAKLARIRLTDEELDKFTPELQKIMGFVEQLSEVNTDNVEPMTGVGTNFLRLREEDKVADGGKANKVLANAPESKYDCFVVPKVVDQG